MSTATKTRKTRSSKYQTASELKAAGILDKPLKQRGVYALGRGNKKVTPRNYFLRDNEIAALTALRTAGDEVPNPFNRSWGYYYLETMKALGVNRRHSSERVLEKFKELASAPEAKHPKTGETFWKTFKNKPMRNEKTGRNWLGRFEQNVEVLQRVEVPGRKNVNPYGQTLLDLGQKVMGTKGVVIEITIGQGGKIMHCLNTDSDRPINETKRRKTKVLPVDETTSDEPTETPVIPNEVAPLPVENATATDEPIATEPAVTTDAQPVAGTLDVTV